MGNDRRQLPLSIYINHANLTSTINIQPDSVQHDSKAVYHSGYLDEDSHTDMHYTGSNFTFLKFSGYKCDVDPFLDSYTMTTGVPIVTAATAVQLTAGDVIYLISLAALWFGDQMETSLFNGNVVRDAGIQLCTDPYDPHHDFIMSDQGRGLVILLQRHGNFIGVCTYKPDHDLILQAIANRDRNIIYLDPQDEYEPQDPGDIKEHMVYEVSSVDASDSHILDIDKDNDYLTLCQVSTALDPTQFARGIISSVNVLSVGSAMAGRRHASATPEHISDIFGVSLDTPKQTLQVTTQHGIRSAVNPLRRQYQMDLLSLKYRCLNTTMYTDTMHFKVKSLTQHKCAQLYATNDFATAYPVWAERFIGNTLGLLAEDVGIPREMITNNAMVMTGPETEFAKQVRFLRIKMKSTEPYHSRQNKGEWIIGELCRRWHDKRRKKNMPCRLWDYALVWCTGIFSKDL